MTSTRADRAARGFAIVRGVMLLVFCAFFLAAPETLMPGSSAEPARSLGLVFASRTILLGIALVVLALLRRREALAWVFFADAALQVFDTGLSLATAKGLVTALPIALGVLDVWAGLVLRRASRGPS